MAAILTLPSNDKKGVIVFTTQDRDQLINFDKEFKKNLLAKKNKWIFGLHHNWHDHHFRYDDFFDFSMAGDGDLIETSGKPFPRINMDACNFSPRAFAAPGNPEKFWDIIALPRVAYFKRLPLLLETFAELYSSGIKPRVLCITPMPKYDFWSRKTTFYNARERFEELFPNQEDRMRFTFLTLTQDHPFPLDLPTLAHLYRSSKLFVHFADDERRCRIAAYAWSAGIPVIARDCVASILPERLRCEPYLFRVGETDNYLDQIKRALQFTEQTVQADFSKAACEFDETHTVPKMIRWLAEKYPVSDKIADYFSENLDIRLGRHFGYISNPNHLRIPSSHILLFLSDWSVLKDEYSKDPERVLEKALQRKQSGTSLAEPRHLRLKRISRNLKHELIQFVRPFIRRIKDLVLR